LGIGGPLVSDCEELEQNDDVLRLQHDNDGCDWCSLFAILE
jgi:hypothetical protein